VDNTQIYNNVTQDEVCDKIRCQGVETYATDDFDPLIDISEAKNCPTYNEEAIP
jgi:hypothetical protein